MVGLSSSFKGAKNCPSDLGADVSVLTLADEDFKCRTGHSPGSQHLDRMRRSAIRTFRFATLKKIPTSGEGQKYPMKTIGVIAHNKKVLGEGLDQLRSLLAERGYPDPLWYEASSSSKTPKLAKKAVAHGAELLFIWGGDGTVQRCVDAVVGLDVELALLPAGTANLLANNLKIPLDLEGALEVGFEGPTRQLDVGVVNGECFAVMAGMGFDAIMMEEADGKKKDRFGRLAYVWTGAKATKINARTAKVRVDGKRWFDGKTTCVLVGQMAEIAKDLSIFPDSDPADSVLELGVVTAKNLRQWAQLFAVTAIGNAHRSPLTRMGQGRLFEIVFDRATPYELDGGARKARKKFKVRVKPRAITVHVPAKSPE